MRIVKNESKRVLESCDGKGITCRIFSSNNGHHVVHTTPKHIRAYTKKHRHTHTHTYTQSTHSHMLTHTVSKKKINRDAFFHKSFSYDVYSQQKKDLHTHILFAFQRKCSLLYFAEKTPPKVRISFLFTVG